MQAAAVLLLELAFRAQHVPEKAIMVSKAAKKALDWLATLSKTNQASERAWKLCDGFLRRLAPHVGIDVNDFSDNDESSSASILDAPDIAEAAVREEQAVDNIAFNPSGSLSTAPATVDDAAADMDSITCSPMDPSGTPHAVPVSCSLEPDLLDQFMKPDKSLWEKSAYDEYFPYDPATGQITGSFFPGGSSMDLDMGYFWGDAVY